MDLKAIKHDDVGRIQMVQKMIQFGLCEHYSEFLGSIEREFVISSAMITFSGSPLSELIQFTVEPDLFWTSALGLMVW